MLNFQAVRDEKLTFAELVADLTPDDLRRLTDMMIDKILDLISDCVDADVTFQPSDPQAHDPYAATPDEATMAWTLGHVVVHITASGEETAAMAAEMARGVKYHGRTRYEVPWQEIRTIEACRKRLEESRRMRLGSLSMWPDEPHLEIVCKIWEDKPQVNAIGRFVLGLMHDESHLEHIADIVGQAKAARKK
ncbi:MAG: DinB family protein [Anaerolineales bacterium]|jgi:hypothetical protein